MSTLLYGINPVREALQRRRRQPLELLLRGGSTNPRLVELNDLACREGVPVRELPREELDRLAGDHHQGVALRVAPLPKVEFEDLLAEACRAAEPPLWLVLDGITDPHNLGAILRNADAVGCHAVLAPKDRSCPLNATVAKSSAGALDAVPVCQVTNLSRALEQLKQSGCWVYGLAGDEGSTSIYATDLLGPVALVVGAEGKGIRPNVRKHCDQLLAIPMRGEVSSLNASVASGVALFEVLRQRLAEAEG